MTTRKPRQPNDNGNGHKTRPNGLEKNVPPVAFLTTRALNVEKERVAIQVRLAHLKRLGTPDAYTEALLSDYRDREKGLKDRLRTFIDEHPASMWLKRLNCPLIILTEIVGKIMSFGRWYPEGDPMIPVYVNREAVADNDGDRWVWVKGIERLPTVSSLWKLANLTPDSKRTRDKKASGMNDLKTLCYRLVQYGFIFNAGKSRYYNHYATFKVWKTEQLREAGVVISPTPKGRFCPECKQEKSVPATTFFCPDCDTKLGKKEEPEGVIWAGHLDNMARRKAAKLFLSHLWTVWRKAEGLPVTQPYVGTMPEHTIIDPWEMCDLPGEVPRAAL